MNSKKNEINILVMGLLSSGSSAVVDMLSEYDNFNIIPDEFNDFRASRMVADQLTYQQSVDFPNIIDLVIRNKSKKRLIYNIFPFLKFNLRTLTNIRSRYHSSYLQIRQLNLLKRLNIRLKSDISFEEKTVYANQWIKDIGQINLKGKQFIVFNQPIEIGIDDKIWRAVFQPFKLICVYRNPKDQLADIIKRGFLSASYDAPKMTVPGVNVESIYGRNRMGAFKFHLDALKKRMEWVDLMKTKLSKEEFLLIDFEGLVNNYNEYKKVIENFIGDENFNHIYSGRYFDPTKSNKNIGIYKNILNDEELGLLKEFDFWYNKMTIQNQIQQERILNNTIRYNNVEK